MNQNWPNEVKNLWTIVNGENTFGEFTRSSNIQQIDILSKDEKENEYIWPSFGGECKNHQANIGVGVLTTIVEKARMKNGDIHLVFLGGDIANSHTFSKRNNMKNQNILLFNMKDKKKGFSMYPNLEVVSSEACDQVVVIIYNIGCNVCNQ